MPASGRKDGANRLQFLCFSTRKRRCCRPYWSPRTQLMMAKPLQRRACAPVEGPTDIRQHWSSVTRAAVYVMRQMIASLDEGGCQPGA